MRLRSVSSGLLAMGMLSCLLVACKPAPDPKIAEAVRGFDVARANIERSIADELRPLSSEPASRGRNLAREAADRVLTPDTRKRLDELRALAADESDLGVANGHLAEARQLLAREELRASGIKTYLLDAPDAPYWRKYWSALFIANDQPVAEPDPMLMAIDSRMSSAMDKGDFRTAAEESKMLGPVFGEAMSRAAGTLAKSRADKAVYTARRTRCLPGAPPNRSTGKPTIVPGAELDRFYPVDAKRAGEQGTVVLRIKVDGEGCGQQVAVLVHSGLPDLDQAALDWFETAQFSAAWRAGATVESELTTKVRFQLNDEDH